MSTKEKKIGFIAGGGTLPLVLAKYLQDRNVDLYVVNITGDDLTFAPKLYKNFKYTEVAKILEFFKSNDIKDLVFCGTVERPKDLSSLKTDFEGAKLLASILSRKILGDNNILLSVKGFLEARGFKLLSINQLMPSLVSSKGVLTDAKPSQNLMDDLHIGLDFLDKIADFDVGQSIIIENKRIIAIEGAEGTDNMIMRSKKFIAGNALLVKIPKKNQISEIDLPTIGPKTIENALQSAVSAIAIKAGETIILELEKTLDLANKNGFTILAI
jgi:DUF1009 family protein